MKTIACCIPCNWDFIPMKFFTSWMGMMIYAQGRYEMLLLISRTSNIGEMRQEAVKEAVINGADYILHLDADEVYPPETPKILMNHVDNGLEVVGGLYVSRDFGIYSAFMFKEDPFGIVPAKIKPNTGLQKVDTRGMGGVMTALDVYRKIPQPWFQGVVGHGEDVAFCKKCKDAGIDVWIDTDLHFGHLTFKARYP